MSTPTARRSSRPARERASSSSSAAATTRSSSPSSRRAASGRPEAPVVVLGIESSCDDSAAAVLDAGVLRSSVVSSQDAVHGPYGGVVPELASRHHVRNMLPVIDAALARAERGLDAVDGIAVTCGPGLIGSLLVGLSVGRGIAHARGLPIVGVNHLEGHLLAANRSEERRVGKEWRATR